MIAILADETCEKIGRAAERWLRKNGKETAFISTAGLQIGTCYSCGYCSTKEYGKCFQKDDMDAILRILVKSETMLVVSPIVFGSYSSRIKMVLDRTCVICDSHYYVVKGEMVKGMRSDLEHFEVIGVKQDCSEKEWTYFKSLVNENIKIMNRKGHTFLLKQKSDAGTGTDNEANIEIEKIMEVISHE